MVEGGSFFPLKLVSSFQPTVFGVYVWAYGVTLRSYKYQCMNKVHTPYIPGAVLVLVLFVADLSLVAIPVDDWVRGVEGVGGVERDGV